MLGSIGIVQWAPDTSVSEVIEDIFHKDKPSFVQMMAWRRRLDYRHIYASLGLSELIM